MKQMFTLLLILGLMAAATAQPGPKRAEKFPPLQKTNVVLTLSSASAFEKSYVFTLRERNRAIAKINRQFSRQIQRERNRLFVGHFEKMRRIGQLERQRDFEIRKVNARYYSPRNAWHRKMRYKRSKW